MGIHKWEPYIYIGLSPSLHLQCIIKGLEQPNLRVQDSGLQLIFKQSCVKFKFFFHELYCSCYNLGTYNNIIILFSLPIPSISFDWLFKISLCLKGEMADVEMSDESLPELDLITSLELHQEGN